MQQGVVRKERSVPIRSPVTWTVLGLVIERPSYGWELWKRFERLYGDVLPIGNESNIYAALNALSEKGFIARISRPGGSKPSGASRQPKPHYRVTDSGLSAYEAWVVAQAREHHRRSLQFARQLGVFAEQPGTALELLKRYEQACLDDRDAAIPTPTEFPTRTVPSIADRFASAYGRGVKAATLEWIEYVRRELVALDRAKAQF
jgi:DNA-binding PadR family transcriptional regulator